MKTATEVFTEITGFKASNEYRIPVSQCVELMQAYAEYVQSLSPVAGYVECSEEEASGFYYAGDGYVEVRPRIWLKPVTFPDTQEEDQKVFIQSEIDDMIEIVKTQDLSIEDFDDLEAMLKELRDCRLEEYYRVAYAPTEQGDTPERGIGEGVDAEDLKRINELIRGSIWTFEDKDEGIVLRGFNAATEAIADYLRESLTHRQPQNDYPRPDEDGGL